MDYRYNLLSKLWWDMRPEKKLLYSYVKYVLLTFGLKNLERKGCRNYMQIITITLELKKNFRYTVNVYEEALAICSKLMYLIAQKTQPLHLNLISQYYRVKLGTNNVYQEQWFLTFSFSSYRPPKYFWEI